MPRRLSPACERPGRGARAAPGERGRAAPLQHPRGGRPRPGSSAASPGATVVGLPPAPAPRMNEGRKQTQPLAKDSGFLKGCLNFALSRLCQVC